MPFTSAYNQVRRQVRKEIGRGRTESGRGVTTMFFPRGKKAHRKALVHLTVRFGVPHKVGLVWNWTIYSTDLPVSVFLCEYQEGTNNWVGIHYMPHIL